MQLIERKKNDEINGSTEVRNFTVKMKGDGIQISKD
jgi:hypothetical protein